MWVFFVYGEAQDTKSLLDEIKRQTNDLEKLKDQEEAVSKILDQADSALDNEEFSKSDFHDLKKGLEICEMLIKLNYPKWQPNLLKISENAEEVMEVKANS